VRCLFLFQFERQERSEKATVLQFRILLTQSLLYYLSIYFKTGTEILSRNKAAGAAADHPLTTLCRRGRVWVELCLYLSAISAWNGTEQPSLIYVEAMCQKYFRLFACLTYFPYKKKALGYGGNSFSVCCPKIEILKQLNSVYKTW
jgi:hypothetical protein